MEDTEAWARMLLALDRHTDDIAGERQAVNDYIAAFYAAQENT